MAVSTLPALAVPVASPDAVPSRGEPIAQNFLEGHGDNVSLVATPNGVSCVASRPLPIREAVYRDPDGTRVAFAEVERSPASSVQAIARPGNPTGFRIQLKYSPDTAQPVELGLGDAWLELSDRLEPSRDSLWLTGAAAEALVDAFRQGEAPLLRATSADTGRMIEDRIDPPSIDGLDACLETLSTLEAAEATARALAEDDDADAPAPAVAADLFGAGDTPRGSAEEQGYSEAAADAELALAAEPAGDPQLPVPVTGVRLELRALADPATRVSEADLQGCRMRDIPEELYLGQLTSVTGFFSQTRDVYVAFDAEGGLERAYVPGIFDSDLSAGVNAGRVSLAADSNVPDAPNMVRGCLGDTRLEAPICVYPGDGDGSYVLAECGVLGVADDRDIPFVPDLTWRAPPPATGTGTGTGTSVPPPARLTFLPPGGSSSFPPSVNPFPPQGGDEPPPNGGDKPPPESPEVPPIPLPAAIWLMLAALASLTGLRVLRARNASA